MKFDFYCKYVIMLNVLKHGLILDRNLIHQFLKKADGISIKNKQYQEKFARIFLNYQD